MAQKVRLERCFRGKSQPGSKSGGRAPIKGPSPVRERAASNYGPVGSRRPPPPGAIVPPPPRRMAPPPIRMPFNPPPAPPPQGQGGRGRGGRGRGGAVGPQQPQGPPFLHPMGMPGLLQPPGPADPIQRLALMMALMVLGMPQVYSCTHHHWMRGTAGRGYLRAEDLSAGWVRKGDRDLGNEGRVGHEAVEETACGTLHGYAVIFILHVWTRRPDKEG